MRDTHSLAGSVATLSNQYNDAISRFDSIQLSRAFTKEDFSTNLLKLGNAKLRLSRWGKSLALGDSIEDMDMTLLKPHFSSEAHVKKAKDLLEQIIDSFSEAETLSDKYKRRAVADDNTLEACKPETDLEPPVAQLHRGMRRLTLERQRRSRAEEKPKWTLHQEKQIKRLIEDITELVDKLTDLFPDALQYQRDLCDAEVLSIGENESITRLREITASQDKLLEEAFQKAESGTHGVYNIVFGANNAGIQIAHNSGTMSGIVIEKSSGGLN